MGSLQHGRYLCMETLLSQNLFGLIAVQASFRSKALGCHNTGTAVYLNRVTVRMIYHIGARMLLFSEAYCVPWLLSPLALTPSALSVSLGLDDRACSTCA